MNYQSECFPKRTLRRVIDGSAQSISVQSSFAILESSTHIHALLTRCLRAGDKRPPPAGQAGASHTLENICTAIRSDLALSITFSLVSALNLVTMVLQEWPNV